MNILGNQIFQIGKNIQNETRKINEHRLFALKTRSIANLSEKIKKLKISSICASFLIESIKKFLFIINEKKLIFNFIVNFFKVMEFQEDSLKLMNFSKQTS